MGLPGRGLPPTLPTDIKQTISLVNVGINYRFGGY
jgi:hypothetical protein